MKNKLKQQWYKAKRRRWLAAEKYENKRACESENGVVKRRRMQPKESRKLINASVIWRGGYGVS